MANKNRDDNWDFYLQSLSNSARDSNSANDPAFDPSILQSVKKLYELCKAENSEHLVARVYLQINKLFHRAVASLSQSRTSNGLLLLGSDASSPRLLKQQVVQRIRWEKPPEGWMKLNTDGSAIGNPGPASCGGVIRDNTGHWIVGFNRSIRVATSFTAELWGLRDGLNMACSLNISSLIVELDAKGIVDALVNSGYVNHAISPILDVCRLLITRIPQIQFKHCFRQANRCADALARMSGSLEVDFSFFNSPPVDILCVFEDDCVGVPCSRLCYTPVGPS